MSHKDLIQILDNLYELKNKYMLAINYSLDSKVRTQVDEAIIRVQEQIKQLEKALADARRP